MMQEEYFAVIAKAQLRDGSYRKTSELSPAERRSQRSSLREGHYSRMHEQGEHLRSTGRGFNDVWHRHGVQPGLDRAMKETTRPSKVHRDVHYGSSVSPTLEGHIDRAYKPGMGHRNGVVFHHGQTMDDAYAAASSPHVTTGHKGRVIINAAKINEHGRHHNELHDTELNARGATFESVINHEAAHTKSTGNPHRFVDPQTGAIRHHKSVGEEARADGMGVRGRGLYERIETVKDKNSIREARQQLKDPHLHQTMRDYYHEHLPLHERYHDVHDTVQRAYGTTNERRVFAMPGGKKKPIPMPGGKPNLPTHRPIHLPDLTKLPVKAGTGVSKPLIIGGAAAGLVGGGVAAHHLLDHYRRDHSGKFAPGANPNLRKH